MDTIEEVAALRREVRALKDTVGALVELLHRADAFGMDRAQVERKLSAAARLAQEHEEEEEEPSPALVPSAYRGVVAAAGGRACAICCKALAEDDPELTLKTRGRVCVFCFNGARG